MNPLSFEKPKKPTGSVDIKLWEERWAEDSDKQLPYPWYFLQKGYRAYPLDLTIGGSRREKIREFLFQMYGMQTIVDEQKNLVYVR